MEREQERNIYIHVCFASIISGISLIISIIAILIWKCNYNPMTWDFANSIIAILSILVTVLVAGQIFNAISINSRVKSMENKTDTMQAAINGAEEERNNIRKYAKALHRFTTGNIYISQENYSDAFCVFCLAAIAANEIKAKEILDLSLAQAIDVGKQKLTKTNNLEIYYEEIDNGIIAINDKRIYEIHNKLKKLNSDIHR